MSNDDRVTRPTLPRTGPVRGWTTPAGATVAPTGETPDPPRAGDVISNAVDLGYRVLDEYMRQGQQAARRFGVRPERAEEATDDLQALATRMARYTSDFLGVWSQFVDVALSSGVASPAGRTNGQAPGSAPAAAARTTVAVRIEAVQPVTVTLDLASSFVARGLTVQELRSADPTKSWLGGVRFEPTTPVAPALVRVVVPATQPSGVYTAVVVDDETGRFAGTIAVAVGEGAG